METFKIALIAILVFTATYFISVKVYRFNQPEIGALLAAIISVGSYISNKHSND